MTSTVSDATGEVVVVSTIHGLEGASAAASPPARQPEEALARAVEEGDLVSVNTVKTQLKSVYRKLGARNRDEAIAIALDRHILAAEE